MDKATVTALAIKRDGSGEELARVVTEMSTDLPADNIGEVVCDAIQQAWRKGNDPVGFKIVLLFD